MTFPRHVFFVLLSLMLFASAAGAGTVGTVAGLVTDPDGEPLVGASVMVLGTGRGAVTDPSGEYAVVGLEPGSYEIRFSMVGMGSSTRSGVYVTSDAVTRVDATLSPTAAGETVITVTGQRGEIMRDVASTMTLIDRWDIETMPSIGVIDVIDATPGVSVGKGGIHVRGGRGGEVQYLVDGVSLRSPVTGSFVSRLPTSAIQETSVLTGGLPAEYGSAMSGVVNIVTREGGSHLSGRVAIRGGATSELLESGWARNYTRGSENGTYRGQYAGVEASVGGPDPVFGSLLPALGVERDPNATFFAAGEWGRSGISRTDSRGLWDNNRISDWKGSLKLAFSPADATRVRLLALYSWRGQGWDEWKWSTFGEDHPGREPPDIDWALPTQYEETLMGSVSLNRMLGDESYVDLKLSVSRICRWHYIDRPGGGYYGDSFSLSDWYSFFPPERDEDFQGFVYSGLHEDVLTDSESRVFAVSSSFTGKVSSGQRLRLGAEASLYDIGDISVHIEDPLVRSVSYWSAKPESYALYVQDMLDLRGGMTANLGVRLDAFRPGSSGLDADEDTIVPAENKYSVSPRVGLTNPISDRAVLFFSYGHYFQMPDMNQLYFGTGSNLSGAYSLAGNPNLEPERTISYEAGFRWTPTRSSLVSATAFFKDIEGLVSTQWADDDTRSTSYYVNDDSYGNVNGVELAGDLGTDWLRLSGSYVYSLARGRYSSSTEGFWYGLEGFELPPAEDGYLDWDRRHSAQARMVLRLPGTGGPGDAGPETIWSWRWGSGYPYTAADTTTLLPEVNNRRYPWTMSTDLTLKWHLAEGGLELTPFVTVYNLFNRSNIRNIYDAAWYLNDADGDGEPDGDPGGPRGNPGAWEPARHAMGGVVLTW